MSEAVLSKEPSTRKRCGMCGSTENLIGPHAGGPFPWYCKTCKDFIRKWEDAKKEHHNFIMRIIKGEKEDRRRWKND